MKRMRRVKRILSLDRESRVSASSVRNFVSFLSSFLTSPSRLNKSLLGWHVLQSHLPHVKVEAQLVTHLEKVSLQLAWAEFAFRAVHSSLSSSIYPTKFHSEFFPFLYYNSSTVRFNSSLNIGNHTNSALSGIFKAAKKNNSLKTSSSESGSGSESDSEDDNDSVTDSSTDEDQEDQEWVAKTGGSRSPLKTYIQRGTSSICHRSWCLLFLNHPILASPLSKMLKLLNALVRSILS